MLLAKYDKPFSWLLSTKKDHSFSCERLEKQDIIDTNLSLFSVDRKAFIMLNCLSFQISFVSFINISIGVFMIL